MEKKRYISFNQKLIDGFAEFGFKRKNMHYFVKKPSEDISQSLIFGHSTQGRAHVKYYAIRASIEFPKVLQLAKENELFLTNSCFYNSNIGELMPKPSPLKKWLMPERPAYLEWLIGEDTDEKYDNEVIDSMIHHVKKYAVPFLNRYSTPAAVVEGIKKCAYTNRYGNDYQALAVLLLYGSKEDFLWFVEQRSYEKQFHVYEPGQHWDYKNPQEPLDRVCQEFLDYAETIQSIVEASRK